VIRASKQNLQTIAAVGVAKLGEASDYSEWLRKMQKALPNCSFRLMTVWSFLPKYIEQDFQSYCASCLEVQKIDSEVENSVAVLWAWDRFDFERRMKSTPMRNRTSQPWMKEPGPTATNFREKAIASRNLRSAVLQARSRQEQLGRRRSGYMRCGFLCSGLLGGWVFSPLGWFSVTLFLISAGYFAWSIGHKKYLPHCAMAFLFFSLFLVGGISRDLLDDVRPTAMCSDNSYSYSAHRSGTCSWHGGVAEWNPTFHHWWQTLLGI
jgi:hypothetical protein